MAFVIVIDVGCAEYDGFSSIQHLIKQLKLDIADHVFGFDPSPATPNMIHLNMGKLDVFTGDELPPEGPMIQTERKAAWTYDGEINFTEGGLGSFVTEDSSYGTKVPCFDLAVFIRSLPTNQEIVLKIDAEGAEYPLLEHLISTRTDELLKFAWVEWHRSSNPRQDKNWQHRRLHIEKEISCELAEWNL